jgi:hypothetical protein
MSLPRAPKVTTPRNAVRLGVDHVDVNVYAAGSNGPRLVIFRRMANCPKNGPAGVTVAAVTGNFLGSTGQVLAQRRYVTSVEEIAELVRVHLDRELNEDGRATIATLFV